MKRSLVSAFTLSFTIICTGCWGPSKRDASDIAISKIEEFRKAKGRLPDSLSEAGAQGDESCPCYCKTGDSSYLVWYGTTLGESDAYDSETKKWSSLGRACVAKSPSPSSTSIAELSLNPQAFDGRLVSVRASLVFGWEGDNFLFDTWDLSLGKTPPHNKPSVWFYCRPGYERLVYNAHPGVHQIVRGRFTGYFHFVPNSEGRVKDNFDPGPLQLEVNAVTETNL